LAFVQSPGVFKPQQISATLAPGSIMIMPKTLIVIPTYNERENIVLIIPEIRKRLPAAHILVVDDNSPDGTSRCVKDRQRKEGLGRAYISGFKWALERDYELIFEMDADFSHDPRYLPDFITAAQQGADLVLGSRYISGVNVVNWPMSRLLLSYFGNIAARLVAGVPVKDCTGGFKCFRRHVLERLDLSRIGSSGYSFQVEMNYHVWRKGFKIVEIPIIFTDRQRGESKMSTSIVREGLLLLWKLRFLTMFTRSR
jgi:dolichol-phosphate mannosyltransferase